MSSRKSSNAKLVPVKVTNTKNDFKKTPDEFIFQTEQAFEILEKSYPQLQELNKLTVKYHKQLEVMISIGRELADALTNMCTLHKEEVGRRINEIACTQRYMFTKEDKLLAQFQKAITTTNEALNTIPTIDEQTQACYKRTMKKEFGELQKLEEDAHKAGKKGRGGPAAMQTAIQAITNKLNEVAQVKEDQLRMALQLKHQRFVNVLDTWVQIMKVQKEIYQSGVDEMALKLDAWIKSASEKTLPEDTQALTIALATSVGKNKQQTFTEIQQRVESGEWPPPSEYQYYYEQQEQPSRLPPPPHGMAPPPPPLHASYDDIPPPPPPRQPQMRALYPYVAQHIDELTFNAGDVITLLAEDDGYGNPGWWQGQLNGVSGKLPANYVEKL